MLARVFEYIHPLFLVAVCSLLLSLIKLIAFMLTGSMIVLGSAFDSMGDTLTSFINFRMQQFAKKKADPAHPYGHGGFEVLSSLTQGLIISALAIILLYQSSLRLISGTGAELSEQLWLAILALYFAALAGAILQWVLQRYQRSLELQGELSLSVLADRAHYLGDFVLNMASATALLGIWYWQLAWLDSVAGMVAALIMLRVAYPILKQSYIHITHQELEEPLQKEMIQRILGFDRRIHNVHRFRSRRLGPSIFIDFHLKLDSDLTLKESHQIAEQIERDLRQSYSQTDITIHVDPADEPRHAGELPSYSKPKGPSEK